MNALEYFEPSTAVIAVGLRGVSHFDGAQLFAFVAKLSLKLNLCLYLAFTLMTTTHSTLDGY